MRAKCYAVGFFGKIVQRFATHGGFYAGFGLGHKVTFIVDTFTSVYFRIRRIGKS